MPRILSFLLTAAAGAAAVLSTFGGLPAQTASEGTAKSVGTVLAAATPAAGSQEAQDLAGQVVASGVRSGLCVVLPAGDGAALGVAAGEGRYVVQGLALDAAQATEEEPEPAAVPA